MAGCAPLLKDPLGQYWTLGVQDAGSLTTTAFNSPIAHQANPILMDLQGRGTNWQLSADINGNIVTTRLFRLPTIRRDNLPYIPLVSPNGITSILTTLSDGILSTTVLPPGLSIFFPDIIPYIPNVSMSIFGNWNPAVTCPVCANAVVQVSADLSNWCCACSTFVPPEDTTILVVLDE